MLAYEGIYTKRYDFWHETRQIIKALILAFILILAFLAMTQEIYGYSRAMIIFTFLMMVVLLPIFKYLSKKYLYQIGIWRRKASVHSKDVYFKEEIFGNKYLGYIEADDDDSQTIFIDSYKEDLDVVRNLIETEMQRNHEVIFIPLINEYDLTRSFIYHLSSRRRNLIVYTNRLKSTYRLWTKRLFDIFMSIIIVPILSPLLLFIAYKIRKEEPNSSILFKQERLGRDGEIFVCYKFRTMYEKGDDLLQTYLEENPHEVEYYNTYHKYKNDPRITNIGDTLRRTSLDELPQLFNVIRWEMSFIGPRPYLLNEEVKMGKELDTVLTVRPGITGLWQVSGRSEVDFRSRIALDVWYIRNWNLWMDIVILLKTVKTVLIREGAS
jgi:undecaprenyl-phosphate galactose phosphotransferase